MRIACTGTIRVRIACTGTIRVRIASTGALGWVLFVQVH